MLCKAKQFYVLALEYKAANSCSDDLADKPSGPNLTFPNLFWISIKAAQALHKTLVGDNIKDKNVNGKIAALKSSSFFFT